MNLVIVPAALDELQRAADFYSTKASPELARAFIVEFERAAGLVLSNPSLGTPFRPRVRRYPLRRFPYNIIYQQTAGELRVIAVAHQRRRPGYWEA